MKFRITLEKQNEAKKKKNLRKLRFHLFVLSFSQYISQVVIRQTNRQYSAQAHVLLTRQLIAYVTPLSCPKHLSLMHLLPTACHSISNEQQNCCVSNRNK